MEHIDYVRIEKAIVYLREHFREQPALGEVAAAVGLSEYHFQRLFRQWAGISPKRFVQYLTAEYARKLLGEARSVLEVSYEAGLSGPSRLHDLLVSVEAMTPGEVRRRGAGLRIGHGFHPSPFGDCLVAVTERGLCGLSFVAEDRAAALQELRERWPAAELEEDDAATRGIAERIFTRAADGEASTITLLLGGTNFQVRVWDALLRIPEGAVTTYGRLAETIGAPAAARAVGSAVGANPIAYLIPCHRVIRGSGESGEYRWGATRKTAMLGWEAARAGVGRAPAGSIP